MINVLVLSQLVISSLILWLGLYLISRNPGNGRLLIAGGALIAYAVALSLDLIAVYAPKEVGIQLARWQQVLLVLLTTFWLALLLQLSRSEIPWWSRLRQHPKPWGVIIAASLFFPLGVGLLLVSNSGLSRSWLLPTVGLDLLLLGLAIAVLDAFDEGEALLPHLLRSLDYSFFTALLFGGQVALVMALSTGITFPLLVLLLTTIAAAIFIQTFADTFQTILDRIAFLGLPQIQHERAELRATASAVSRQSGTLDLSALDQASFEQLTRKALSNMGNMPRLAASPLIHLPLVATRLAERELPVDTLSQAAELKTILTESIERLKPRNKGNFGITDEWRHYNALYFPYVVGLKPYSRRMFHEKLEPDTQQALDWFRTQVPERTLYNWQNSAARLIAQDLYEHSISRRTSP